MAYRIRIERRFYGPRTEVSYLGDGCGECSYPTRAEAVAVAAEMDAGIYYLAHNESERPVYKVVRASK